MKLRLSCAVAVFASLTASSFASVAYSDLTPTDFSGGDYGGWFTGGYNPAFEFTSGLIGSTSDIMVCIGDYYLEGSLPFQVNLYQDGGSNDSLGTLLGSWTGWTNASTSGSPYDTVVDVATPGASLISGNNYWVELQYGAYDNFSYYPGPTWAFNNAGVSQNQTEDGGFYGVNTAGGYQVNVSSAPGPIAVAPFVIGMLARRRKKA